MLSPPFISRSSQQLPTFEAVCPLLLLTGGVATVHLISILLVPALQHFSGGSDDATAARCNFVRTAG